MASLNLHRPHRFQLKHPFINEGNQKSEKAGFYWKIKHLALVALASLCSLATLAGVINLFSRTSFSMLSKYTFILSVSALGVFLSGNMLNSMASRLPQSLVSLANYIYSIVCEFFSLMALNFLRFVNLEKRDPQKGNGQQPILLIHGLYSNSGSWAYYRYRFSNEKLGPVFTVHLGKPFDSIETHAEKVRNKVLEIQKVTGRNDITLIGHSMGGIVACVAASKLAECNLLVTDIITLGSPLKGAFLAAWGIGKAVKEMHPQSAFLANLSKRILNLPSTTHFFHIASKTDLLVPLSSALFNDTTYTKRLTLSNVGHLSLLFSDSLIEEVINYYKIRQNKV
ncbi:putative membrane protein [Neochlamydia sp. EPS4]|uniref:esterase/lipase family protein n=1 Tax=Neochlamydia sp. EPS4 TaxID=1478175 RepID=UPI000582AF76|nr:alpha/beta fold hydrolase [Neochlamydia sp. EPS4]KIC76329.1 putative membrane protein [Neochlamydia sp. EPS4]